LCRLGLLLAGDLWKQVVIIRISVGTILEGEVRVDYGSWFGALSHSLLESKIILVHTGHPLRISRMIRIITPNYHVIRFLNTCLSSNLDFL